MYAALAILSVAIAIASFIYFQQNGNAIALVAGIVFVILTVVTGGVFLSTKLNKNEDIHITD